MSSPKRHVPKLYVATTHDPVTPALVETLLNGVQLHDEPSPLHAQRCEARGEYQLEIVVEQGKYHQVKRMLAAVGNPVVKLHRSRMGQFDLPSDLAPGQWRWLSPEDLARVVAKND